jgi:hypothetical protein
MNDKKNSSLHVSQDKILPCQHLNHFFMNLLLEKKYRVPSRNFVKKNVLCQKGDEITGLDGTQMMVMTVHKAFSLNRHSFHSLINPMPAGLSL